ncbi:MAG: prolipoprotein diacylglyceryl transferase, partial [Myxococcota bacterium]|nr:prolipoprotein diacylglyceryl transferase [Myxococcota bacterium]
MRPVVADWLAQHGVPVWLSPSYAAMVGLASLIAAAIVLRVTARDGEDVRGTATTLLIAYGAALVGGYLYEIVRVTPSAIAQLSLHPYAHVGRAAYGGLLFATAATALHLRHRRAPLGAFFDRVALTLGIVFVLVRTGCLLEGCDYGLPTEGALGVQYPPGSIAAIAHAHRGWVVLGAPSLATHPTQLYEGAVALGGSAVALGVY